MQAFTLCICILWPLFPLIYAFTDVCSLSISLALRSAWSVQRLLLPSQLGRPVHQNASFESPPSSFLLSTPAARLRTHARTNTGKPPLTGDFSHTGMRFFFFFLEWTDRSRWKLDKLSGSVRRCEKGCMLKGVCYGTALEFTTQKLIFSPSVEQWPVILRLPVITSYSFMLTSTASAQL